MSATGSPRRWTSPGASLGGALVLGSGLLLLAVLARFHLAHEYHDFTGLYMGGVVAREGAWADLYPIPVPDAVRPPGAPDASSMRPGYARLAAERGVPDWIRFIHTPPVAVALSPLALLSLRTAHLVWPLLSVAFAIVIAWQAGAVFARLADRPTILRGAIVLLVAVSPTMYQACRMGSSRRSSGWASAWPY
jgi:hypothetical protein